MDTILASIRRILNEDEVAPAEAVQDKRDPAPAPPGTPPGGQDPGKQDKDDVLVLGKAMMVSPEKFEPAAPKPPIAVPAIPHPPSAPAPVMVVAPLPVVQAEPEAVRRDQDALEGLIAARTRAATTQSFDALHEAMRREQAPPSAPASPNLLRSGGPTLEDLVRDELRGLISSWLDEHLPRLVETLVRSEIEKLTRRTG